MQHAGFSTVLRAATVGGRSGLGRLRNGRPLVARLHGDRSGSSPAGGGIVTAKSTASNLNVAAIPGIVARGSSTEWNAEHWRPFASTVGPKPATSSVTRGFKSSVANQGEDKGKKADGDGKKCCDHADDPNHVHGKTDATEKQVPAVLKGEDEDGSFDITSHPMWKKESVEYLFENNRRWVAQKKAKSPDFFKKLASVHKPEFLFIGCSDARLSVQHMLGLEAGELFVHRNVANMVMHNDLNLLTALTYAVDYLKVKHIIVCGHYDCGGVRAAMKNHDHGLIENWIMGIKDVARYHRDELKQLGDNEAIHRRLVELNVQEQCVKLYANPVVQKSQANNGSPHIHAMVFDVGEGLVKELDIDFRDLIRKYRHVYSMYDFRNKK